MRFIDRSGLFWRVWRALQCLLYGHDLYKFPGVYRPRHNMHFCRRCLRFWEAQDGTKGDTE